MYKVVISQHRLLHYRVEFFDRLRNKCKENGVELHLLHGQASIREKTKKDEGFLPWANKVVNYIWPVGPVDVIWQPVPADLRDPDLFVMIQENRVLSNYALIWRRLRGAGPMLAFWGHGANFQARSNNSLREKWKRFFLRQVDYWFAYTNATVDILKRANFPAERITNLNNSIDTSEYRRQCESVDAEQIALLRAGIGLDHAAPIGLFCGSLYPEKRIDLLIAAGDLLRSRIPKFNIVVIGDGPSMPALRDASATRPWLHLVGIRRGLEKAAWYRAAQVILNPGALGLHILDAFIAGVPLVSTRAALHGPEIVYLENGVNGALSEDNALDYAEAVAQILEDATYGRRLAASAAESGEQFSLDVMVDNFYRGIDACRRLGKKEAL